MQAVGVYYEQYGIREKWLEVDIHVPLHFKDLSLRPEKNNRLVVLHNFFEVGSGTQIFFSKSKSKLHRIMASIPLNKGANKSTLSKKKKKKKKNTHFVQDWNQY